MLAVRRIVHPCYPNKRRYTFLFLTDGDDHYQVKAFKLSPASAANINIWNVRRRLTHPQVGGGGGSVCRRTKMMRKKLNSK